jgi:hypothetical protein
MHITTKRAIKSVGKLGHPSAGRQCMCSGKRRAQLCVAALVDDTQAPWAGPRYRACSNLTAGDSYSLQGLVGIAPTLDVLLVPVLGSCCNSITHA